jgi:hypothetical protein
MYSSAEVVHVYGGVSILKYHLVCVDVLPAFVVAGWIDEISIECRVRRSALVVDALYMCIFVVP